MNKILWKSVNQKHTRMVYPQLQGLFSLEAAIALSIAMLFITSMLLVVMSVQVDMHLKLALQKTAREYVLMSAVKDDVWSKNKSKQDDQDQTFRQSIQDQLSTESIYNLRSVSKNLPAHVSEQKLPSLLRKDQKEKTKPLNHQLSRYLKDLGETHLVGPFLARRIRYWFDQNIKHKRSLNHLLKHPKIKIEQIPQRNLTRIHCFYTLQIGFVQLKRVQVVAMGNWGIHQGLQSKSSMRQTDDSKDHIWLKGNFERGQIFRKMNGQTLSPFYPVYASIKNGVGTSIKSIDLTAPYYQQAERLKHKILGHLLDLENNHDLLVKHKVLKLIIPENSPKHLEMTLEKLKSIAHQKGIQLEIEWYGISSRYQK